MEVLSTTSVLIILILAVVIGVVLRLKAFGAKDGERYRKMQMQEPFVPTSDIDKKSVS